MKIELTGAKFLTLPELGELAARLDILHDKTIRTIDRLQGEIEAQKGRVAKHWQGIKALGPPLKAPLRPSGTAPSGQKAACRTRRRLPWSSSLSKARRKIGADSTAITSCQN
jgi:hypothetical protein